MSCLQVHHGWKIHFHQPTWRCSGAGSNRRLPMCACHQWHSKWICHSQQDQCAAFARSHAAKARRKWHHAYHGARVEWRASPSSGANSHTEPGNKTQLEKGSLPLPIWMTWSLIKKPIAKIQWVLPPMAWVHGAAKLRAIFSDPAWCHFWQWVCNLFGNCLEDMLGNFITMLWQCWHISMC